MAYTGRIVTTFKERLNDICDKSGKQDVDIARDLRISKQSLSAWRLGTRSPREPMVISMAAYFGVATEWLMGFDVPMYSENRRSPVLSKEEEHLVVIYRAADPRYQSLAVELLEEHPRQEASATSRTG